MGCTPGLGDTAPETKFTTLSGRSLSTPDLRGKVMHRRCADYAKDGILRVMDELTGSGRHSMKNFIHLAPGLSATLRDRHVEIRDATDSPVASIAVDPGCEISLDADEHYPEFGRVEHTTRVLMHSEGTLPLRQAYTITRA